MPTYSYCIPTYLLELTHFSLDSLLVKHDISNSMYKKIQEIANGEIIA